MMNNYTYRILFFIVILFGISLNNISFAGNASSSPVAAWKESELKKLACESKYQKFFETLYYYRDQQKRSEPITLAGELAEQGHAPCMYFLVRDWANSSFSNFNTQTLEEALMWAIISLASIRGDIECCSMHTDIETTFIIFCQKFHQKFMPAAAHITEQMVSNAIERAKYWFKTHHTLPHDDTIFPITTHPCWVATLSLTGHSTLTFNDKAIDTTKQYFEQDFETIAEFRRYAQKNFFIRLNNCMNFYKNHGTTVDFISILFPYQLTGDYAVGFVRPYSNLLSSAGNLAGSVLGY